MTRFRPLRLAAVVAVLTLSGQALAQTASAPAPAEETKPAPDPARLAVARQIVLKMFPPGTYKDLLGQSYSDMMGSFTESMGGMPIADIAQIGGLSDDQVQALGDVKLAEVMDIVDPAWRERMKIMTGDMMASMTGLFEKMEPRVREAMARVFARDFTLPQLEEVLRFLETPTGALYAKRSLTVYTDPEIVAEMTAMMPEIIEEMPAIMAAQQRKLEELPPRRKIEDLSDADRQRLADLLGVDVADLNDPDLVPIP